MKFSELEDGEERLERFKRDLEYERREKRFNEWQKWNERMPWIVAAVMGWLFYFLTLFTSAHK